MATAPGRNRCVVCDKVKATSRCGGCLQEFCYNDYSNHRQELDKQLDEVELNRDLLRQTLTEQTSEPQKHPLIQQIDQWEHNSISKIRQTAQEARKVVLKCNTGHVREIETKLNKLTVQLRQSREENDFYETDLRYWNEELTRLTQELAKPSNINLRQDTTPFVTKICVDIMSVSFGSLNISGDTRWVRNGITVAGGNGDGNALNQLSSPLDIYVDDDQTIYIADWLNHRIVEWKSGATSGRVVAGGNGPGDLANQLDSPAAIIVDQKSGCFIIADPGNGRVVRWPRQNGTSGQIIITNVDCWGLAMDNDGYLYVSDGSKDEVKRWRIGDDNGTVVAGGNGQGDRFDQLNRPTDIFIDEDHSVYVTDSKNHRVMKWMKGGKKGVVVAGGYGQGNSLAQLSDPEGVIVDQLGTVYVADQSNHRIMKWLKGATQSSIILAGNGDGKQANQLRNPVHLSFDREGNFYVVDMNNHRIQKFNIDSS